MLLLEKEGERGREREKEGERGRERERIMRSYENSKKERGRKKEEGE